MATCLRELGDAGAAAGAMERLLVPPEDGEERSFPVLRMTDEVEQWVDALLQFGQIEELEAALGGGRLPDELADRMRMMVRCRAVARGDFTTARRWLVEDVTEPGRFESSSALADFAAMDEAGWDEWVEPIVALEQEFEAATGREERARIALRMGDRWMAARGRLTMPSLDPRWIYNSEPELADLQRRKNARFLGVDGGNATEELDRRDEAWHARRAYALAAELAGDGATLARALAEENECLFRMAELTPYQAARAFERDDTAASRAIFERLTADGAGSAVFYEFPALLAAGEWMPGDASPWVSELAILAAMKPDRDRPSHGNGSADSERIRELFARPGASVEELRDGLDAIRAEFLPRFESPDQAGVINDLDDLALFLDEPTTTVMRHKYAALRFGDRRGGRDDPDLEPVADFVEYLNRIARVPDGDGSGTHAVNDTIAGWREFLARYPESAKAEAAQFRLTRLIVRGVRTEVGVEAFFWPDSPIPNGYKRIGVRRDQPFDAGRVIAALDEYDRKFPDGRYAAEVRLLRGGVAIDAGNYARALELLTGILDDESKRDLHLDAGLGLADLFLRLIVADERVAVAEAIRGSERGRVYFERFVGGETCGSRLRPLVAWVNGE